MSYYKIFASAEIKLAVRIWACAARDGTGASLRHILVIAQLQLKSLLNSD